LILVDTSAWIEFFRGLDPVASTVDRALESDEVALCGPVLTELRRGLRMSAERRRVLPLLSGCHLLDQPPALWEEAGDLGYALARRGASVKTLDLLIAAYALSHSVPLLTTDADFERMRRAGIPLDLSPRPGGS
jgi:predicted nucleic acid-binding protein